MNSLPNKLLVRSLQVISLTLSLLVTVNAQDKTATNADQYLSAYANQGRFSGVILIAKDGRVLLRKAYGSADVENAVPNTIETVFRIGSITKSFTSLSILQLQEKGKLNVTDPVEKHLPEIPKPWHGVTIHHLLTHTSGIPDYSRRNIGIDAALKLSESLESKPGDTFKYNNFGYMLLGRVIENVSGVSYQRYLDQAVLRPLKMSHTAFNRNRTIVPHRAHGYVFEGAGLANANFPDMQGANAAGALHSTVDDLYLYDQALNGGNLISNDIRQQLFKGQVNWVMPFPFALPGAKYAYGWITADKVAHPYMRHGGWVDGFVSELIRFPQQNATVILLCNIESPLLMPIIRDLTAIVHSEPFQMPSVHKFTPLDSHLMQRYAGSYTIGDKMPVSVSFHDGRLFFLSPGAPEFEMLPENEESFFFMGAETTARFVLDENKRPSSIRLDSPEFHMNAPRTDDQGK
jgi:CubicO group peptidase (beta-lactamase class C family)